MISSVSLSASPLLFGKLHAMLPATAARYVGTDTERDAKITSPSATALLFGKRRPAALATAAQYVGTDTELDNKGPLKSS